MKFLTSLFLALAISAQAAPLTNTVTFNWLDFGYQVDSVTNKPVKITPLEYATIGSFFMVKTPRIYTNTFAGQCIVTNMQEGSYRVELATALGSITTFTSTIPSTATGSSNYDATSFVTNYATNSGSTRSYSITVSDLRYPSVAGTNIVFTTNAGRVTIAGTVVTGTSPAVASNYLAVTKLNITNGTAYELTVSGLFSSTNMDAKISSASNTVHTALIATNTLLFTNIFSLNTAANNNAANVTSISNRVIQAEVTNAVQQTALAGLTNRVVTAETTNAGSVANITSISNRVVNSESALIGLTNSLGTKQFGSAALTNLSAQVNVATNIIGAGFGIIVSSNNAGTWTITGGTTNYIATTNGMSRNLTNLGQAYSDRLVVTNLVVGTTANTVQITNGTIITTGNITLASPSTLQAHILKAQYIADIPNIYSSYFGGNLGGLIRFTAAAEVGVIQMCDINVTTFGRLIFGLVNSNFPALKRNGASLEIVDGIGNSRATNNLIVPGVVISTNGFILPASTPFTAPASLSGHGGHLWSDGTNLCIVLQNSAGTRTTNKVTMTAWP